LPDISFDSMPVHGPLPPYGISDLFSVDASERARRARLMPTRFVGTPAAGLGIYQEASV